MGWARGSELADELWELVRGYVPPDMKMEVAGDIYDLFCDHDADAWDGDSRLEKDAGVNQESDEDDE